METPERPVKVNPPDWLRAAVANVSAMIRTLPAGTVVWHKGGGTRAVVCGWTIAGDGTVMIQATAGDGTSTFFPFELSTTPIADEDWKNAE